eukprot:GDKJ01057946.1.p1 GENE.GDKJ01057946.1~~GDKJ01057946.1.p1  ORF type:complete len:1265 (-),score=376.21 GDKJ01057946.1:740-4333(-)
MSPQQQQHLQQYQQQQPFNITQHQSQQQQQPFMMTSSGHHSMSNSSLAANEHSSSQSVSNQYHNHHTNQQQQQHISASTFNTAPPSSTFAAASNNNNHNNNNVTNNNTFNSAAGVIMGDPYVPNQYAPSSTSSSSSQPQQAFYSQSSSGQTSLPPHLNKNTTQQQMMMMMNSGYNLNFNNKNVNNSVQNWSGRGGNTSNMVDLIQKTPVLQRLMTRVDPATGAIIISKRVSVMIGHAFYDALYAQTPSLRRIFIRPRTSYGALFVLIFQMLFDHLDNPYNMWNQNQELALKHINFGVRPTDVRLFGKVLLDCLESLADGEMSKYHLKAWERYYDITSTALNDVILVGSHPITQSLLLADKKMLAIALAEAPRNQRAAWACTVSLKGGKRSPLYWALDAGLLEMARMLLADLLTTRADRATVYCGRQMLWEEHPDLINKLCLEGSELITTLLDGSVWWSNQSFGGKRRINLYIKEMWQEQEGLSVWESPLMDLLKLKDAMLFDHIVLRMLVSLKWSLYGRSRVFLVQALFILQLVIYILGYIGFMSHHAGDPAIGFFFRILASFIACFPLCYYFVIAFEQYALAQKHKRRLEEDGEEDTTAKLQRANSSEEGELDGRHPPSPVGKRKKKKRNTHHTDLEDADEPRHTNRFAHGADVATEMSSPSPSPVVTDKNIPGGVVAFTQMHKKKQAAAEKAERAAAEKEAHQHNLHASEEGTSHSQGKGTGKNTKKKVKRKGSTIVEEWTLFGGWIKIPIPWVFISSPFVAIRLVASFLLVLTMIIELASHKGSLWHTLQVSDNFSEQELQVLDPTVDGRVTWTAMARMKTGVWSVASGVCGWLLWVLVLETIMTFSKTFTYSINVIVVAFADALSFGLISLVLIVGFAGSASALSALAPIAQGNETFTESQSDVIPGERYDVSFADSLSSAIDFFYGPWQTKLDSTVVSNYVVLNMVLRSLGVLLLSVLAGRLCVIMTNHLSHRDAFVSTTRAELILSLERLIPKSFKEKIFTSLNFDIPLPLDNGEKGPAGGVVLLVPVKMRMPASSNASAAASNSANSVVDSMGGAAAVWNEACNGTSVTSGGGSGWTAVSAFIPNLNHNQAQFSILTAAGHKIERFKNDLSGTAAAPWPKETSEDNATHEFEIQAETSLRNLNGIANRIVRSLQGKRRGGGAGASSIFDPNKSVMTTQESRNEMSYKGKE